MKFRGIKTSYVKKGVQRCMAILLSAVIFSSTLRSFTAYGADEDIVLSGQNNPYVTLDITATHTLEYLTHMQTNSLDPNKHEQAKKRIVALSDFINKKYPKISAIPSDKVNDYEKKDTKWNPKQADIDAGRDLYLLEWTNGYYNSNPGSGYEILGRIVYLGVDNKIYYTNEVNIDEYARKLNDPGYKAQWDQGRINQALFAMPESCKQILGIVMCNEDWGGNNNNSWWMDSFYISRITSDNRDDVAYPFTNDRGFIEYRHNNGQLVGFVSDYDINQKYLSTMDKDQEWLYLLQTPVVPTSSSARYLAQIVTTEGTDLSDKNFVIEIDYTDMRGEKKTHEQPINDDYVKAAYPTFFSASGFAYSSSQNYKTLSSTLEEFNRSRLEWRDYNGKPLLRIVEDDVLVNDIGQELKSDSYKNYQFNNLAYQMKHFKDFNWETANLTDINSNAAAYFGNFMEGKRTEKSYLSGYAATDALLDIPDYVVSIEGIRFRASSGNIQDIRIYAADYGETDGTRMNGGLSKERVYINASDVECIASLDISAGPVILSGTTVTCTPESENGRTSRKLLLNTGKKMNFYDPDDTLGVVITMADIYEAGIETFAADYETEFNFPYVDCLYSSWDRVFSTSEMKNNLFHWLTLRHKGQHYYNSSNEATDDELITVFDKMTGLEIINLMESYFKDSLALTITYEDIFGARRVVETPIVTTYMLQLYSDHGGQLGTNENEFITGVFQQGQEMALRIPVSQYKSLISIDLGFGKTPYGINNIKNNKYMYVDDPTVDWDPDGTGKTRQDWIEYSSQFSYDKQSEDNKAFIPPAIAEQYLKPYETFKDGALVPRADTISIRSLRFYEHASKENFRSVYNPSKGYAEFRTTLQPDYFYISNTRSGYSLTSGQSISLSVEENTLLKGTYDTSKTEFESLYVVELSGHMLSTENLPPEEIQVSLGYTTTGGEQIKIEGKKLSELTRDYNGYTSMTGRDPYPTGDEFQTQEDLKQGKVMFTLDIDNVSSFDYINLALPDGVTYGWQVNSVTVYRPVKLSQRYSAPKHFSELPVFTRDFEGEMVALNNKPVALQPGKESKTLYFSKVDSDGVIEAPDTDIPYDDEYLIVPPTSLPYEEALKNLGFAVTKYTYTVDVDVANVLDAGSSNYFYFQLVFENGTSGVVLANQQLAADSFRQGYTESFTIHTTQNYGNVTAVRVICDTSSSESNVFDKLNINKITVSLPSNGGAKSWIMDKVGWIDINYQDEGAATTVSSNKESTGFPNSMVVKEFARTRTASTARLLFNISTSATSPAFSEGSDSAYEAALTYIDSSGYTQTYNFNLKNAIFNYIENTSWAYLFRPNMSDYFTLSLNDITAVKSLSIYRADGRNDWVVKDVSISQFSDLGDVYMDTTGEFKRYVENETLITTSTNSEQTITRNGNGTFIFGEHSINVNTSGTNPEGWTTTITRLPVTTQETLNVYLYPGSTSAQAYSFNPENPVPIKGRLEYTFKDNGSTIGSESFTFTETTDINGITVLKASGIKVNGMNQLKSLYLMSDNTENPIVSGAQVERIRGNTIVERLYFDFNDETLTNGRTVSANAEADYSATSTKQTLALQVSSGQNQIFSTNNNVAVSLLYTNENDSSIKQKTVYASPYVFFTDVGITSLDNTSILEIPFEVTGVDQIVGFSIVSDGANISFENALLYNYLEKSTGEDVLIDTCPIAEKISTSTIAKQYMEKANTSVTPVTLTFNTSADSQFQGAGASGRLPLTLNYEDTTGNDVSLYYDNMLNMMPANTVPSAGSSVSIKVQLSNLNKLTSVALSALDDNWHLYKVNASIDKYINNIHIPQQTEAFVEGWISSNTPVTAIFGERNQNKIINFYVTGFTVTSENVETATSGNVLKIKAIPDERVSLMPTVTVEGNPDNKVIWDTSKYPDYMLIGGGEGLIFTVPLTHNGVSTVGQLFSFAAYCSYDTEKTVAVVIEVVDKATLMPDNDDTNTEPEPEVPDTETTEELFVTGSITPNGGTAVEFELYDGDSFTHYIQKDSTATPVEWSFTATANLADHTVEFTPASVIVDASQSGTYTTLMSCLDKNGDEVFDAPVIIKVVDSNEGMSITLADGATVIKTENPASNDNGKYYEFEVVPAGGKTFVLNVVPNDSSDTVDIQDKNGNSLGTSVNITGSSSTGKLLGEFVVVHSETISGESFSVNVRVKTNNNIADTTHVKYTLGKLNPDLTITELDTDNISATSSTSPAKYSLTRDDNYTLKFEELTGSNSNITIVIDTNNAAATISDNTITFNSTAATGTVLVSGRVICKPNADASGVETVHYFEVLRT